MLNKANKQWNGKKIVSEIEKGNLLFNCSIQRGLVWDLERKSLLINSMIEDFPIPAFYLAKQDDNKYQALDGKQRTNTIYQFVKGEFALSENTPSVVDENGNEFEIAEKHFNELEEWMKDQILSYSFTIYYFDAITEEEVNELFYRINNGKPLTRTELMRAKTKCINEFKTIANHNAIMGTLSASAISKHNYLEIAEQVWNICFIENPDFTTPIFKPLIENADVTENQIQILNNAMDYISFAIEKLNIGNVLEEKETKKVLKKLKTKSHIVSVVYFAKKCIELEITKERFAEAIFNFFNSTKTSINENYNNSCGSGSAAKEKIAKRIDAMNSLIPYTQRHIEETQEQNQNQEQNQETEFLYSEVVEHEGEFFRYNYKELKLENIKGDEVIHSMELNRLNWVNSPNVYISSFLSDITSESEAV